MAEQDTSSSIATNNRQELTTPAGEAAARVPALRGVLVCTHRTVTKGRSIFRRSTEKWTCLSAFAGEVPALLLAKGLTSTGVIGAIAIGGSLQLLHRL